MGRNLIKHNDKYAEFSSIVDAFVTPFMTKEEYIDYTKEKYGSWGVKRIDFEKFETIEEIILPLTLNRTRVEAVANLTAVGFTEAEANRLIDQHGKPREERREDE